MIEVINRPKIEVTIMPVYKRNAQGKINHDETTYVGHMHCGNCNMNYSVDLGFDRYGDDAIHCKAEAHGIACK